LSARAFTKVFLPQVITLAERCKAKEVKLVLLGDIFDLIRTEKWLDEDPDDRPWGKSGQRDIPRPRPKSRTERCCLEILGEFSDDASKKDLPEHTILHENWETLKFFRDFKGNFQVPAEVIYVVGNHDRLCNLYPSVRDAVKEILGLNSPAETPDGVADGEWWYPYDYVDETYGVYARHGHQFDPANYAGSDDLSRDAHLKVPVGDVVSTEFAVNLPWTLCKMKTAYPKVADRLVENLKEIDNVRPLSRVVEWFLYQIRREDDDEAKRAMERTFSKVVSDLLQNDLVQNWRSPDTRWDELVRLISEPWLQWLPTGVMSRLVESHLSSILLPLVEMANIRGREADDYAEAAYQWQKTHAIRYVLYGHTHRFLVRPLDVARSSLGAGSEREVLYINTGTWRESIQRTVPFDRPGDFVKFKQLTYAVFYGKDEDSEGKEPGTVSFDIWTGYAQKLSK
jgi:UDP-2,3-diacylglucosamine pyrophosphatase LpxH